MTNLRICEDCNGDGVRALRTVGFLATDATYMARCTHCRAVGLLANRPIGFGREPARVLSPSEVIRAMAPPLRRAA